MKRELLGPLVLLASSLALPALARAQATSTLTFATNADPTFNPWSPNAEVESDLINELIFEGLTRYGSNLQPVPALATRWSVSKNGLVWTFHLRKGVTWQNGRPFTSKDVVFTFNDIALNKKLGANFASDYAPVSQVKAVGPYEVQFLLKTPFSALPSYLAYFEGILPASSFAGVKNPWTLSSFDKQHPIGTGPYQLDKFVPGSYVELRRNDHYWGGKPQVRTILFKIIPNANTQVAEMLSGGLDLISLQNTALLGPLKSDPNLQIIRSQENLYYWVALNQNDPRFRNVLVRRALLLAINRPAIIKSLLGGYGQVATGPIAPLQKAIYDPKVAQYPYDPTLAKKLLAEAGWLPGPNGRLEKGGKPFTITMPTGQFGQLVPMSELVQNYWKAIGIDVQLKVTDWNTYIKQVVVDRRYQATLAWWSTPPTPDIGPYYASSAAVTGSNIPNYRSAKLDALLAAGQDARTPAQEKAAYAKVQEFVASQLPYLYLWYPDILVVKSKRIGGMSDVNLPEAFQHSVNWTVR
jgi:peptide/nickel transport system substrate-binding protein